jgi:drug/metabolite transporter (DMT)-like permease
MNKAQKNAGAADAALLLVALIWGAGFSAVSYALSANISPMLLMALRFSIAALVMVLFARRQLKKMDKRALRQGMIAGIILFAAFLAQTLGMLYTTPANSALLTAANVIIVPFLAWLFQRRRPPLKAFGMAMLCCLGIVVLSYNPGAGFKFNLGDLLSLACAALFAGHIAYLGVASKEADSRALSAVQMSAAALCSLIGLLLFDRQSILRADYAAGLGPVLFLGLFSTCLCFFLQTWGQQKTTSTKAAILLSLESFFGTVFSVLLGLEPLKGTMIVGGALILSSVILMEIDLSAIFHKKRDFGKQG